MLNDKWNYFCAQNTGAVVLQHKAIWVEYPWQCNRAMGLRIEKTDLVRQKAIKEGPGVQPLSQNFFFANGAQVSNTS